MDESTRRQAELQGLADRLGFGMRNVALFDRALTHASIQGETGGATCDYESLEFLGDAVLGLAVAHYLFESLPNRQPGEYSRLRAGIVNRKTVGRVGQALDLAPVVRLGRGEELSGGRQRLALLADSLEALIGALYLDSGWEAAKAFILRAFAAEMAQAMHDLDRAWDFKSRLQQECQARRLGLPQFVVVREEGPDHRKHFEVEVLVAGRSMGRGAGPAKKEAAQAAAREALGRLAPDTAPQSSTQR